LLVYRCLVHTDILQNGVRKDITILHDHTGMFAPGSYTNRLNRLTTDGDFTFLCFIKLQQQLEQGSLTTTTGTYQCRYFTPRYVQINIFQNPSMIVSKRKDRKSVV